MDIRKYLKRKLQVLENETPDTEERRNDGMHHATVALEVK